MILFLAYLLGSIPTGLLLTKLAGLGDIRAIGSGNIGATNVLRTGNKKLAAATLLLDMGKGALAVWVVTHFSAQPLVALAAPLVAVLGHVCPVWLRFKGGKGVATAIGALSVFFWPVGLSIVLIWLAVFFTSRISSLAALIGFWLGPLAGISLALLLDHPWAQSNAQWMVIALVCYPVVVLVTLRHSENIQRLLDGTEHRFSTRR